MSNKWLGSEVGMVLKTATIPTTASSVTENGRTIVKSGTLITDTNLGKGLLVNDVDITDGARVGSIVIRGTYINSKLPIPLTDLQKQTLATQGLMALKIQADLQLSIEPVAQNITLLGKTVSQLQSDIDVTSTEVTGASKYVTGYTEFSSIVEEQSGNYLALKATAVEGATITAQVIGGTSDAVTLDSDGMIVFRLRNNQQKLKFIANLGDKYMPIELSLKNLTLGTI